MLEEKLIAYNRSRAYPFHMPGHKRCMDFPNPYELDITEIEGFDNLHHAQGVLQEAQERAARLYGADHSYYLVNGSTCGILAAISAAVPKGGRVLVARNCHKSVYHALMLREAKPEYVYPAVTAAGVCGQIAVSAVCDALQQYPDCCAVILTSPTYDGIVSDVAQLAACIHEKGIPLIVDAAHGAHFGFVPQFPESPLQAGADAVIVSIHKTLPSFTQTALLHLRGERILPAHVEEYLDVYETSSPSYVLMAGMDRCIRIMEEEGSRLLAELSDRLDRFDTRMQALQRLRILRREELTPEEAYDFDRSKLLILTDRTGRTGIWLQEQLRKRYGLELEMACSSYALALTSLMDTEEGLRRLGDALCELDAELAAESDITEGKVSGPVGEAVGRAGSESGQSAAEEKPLAAYLYRAPEQVLPIAQAMEADGRKVPPEEAVGAVSRSYVVPYPPGIPALVPGERIDAQTVADILKLRRLGIEVEGLDGKNRIKIVK